eukprot:878443-Pleurochrysis_carterae.AAC.1
MGDCDPAVGARNAATSRVRQMRALLTGARALVPHWLAVSVARDANADANRLGHLAQLRTVIAEVEAAGPRPRVTEIPEWCWEVLRGAMRQPGGEKAVDTQPMKMRRRR